MGYGILVLLGFLAWRIAPGLRDWAEGSRRRIAQAYIFAPLLFLALDVANLPLSLYDHYLALEYEQSIQGWGSWFWDWTKGEFLEFGLVGVLIWILYGVIRRSPRRWWFYFWLAAVPIVVFLMFITPVAHRADVLQVRTARPEAARPGRGDPEGGGARRLGNPDRTACSR